MIKVAIANMKGGVGKSTTAMMLADTLALHHEKRVLVVDCDPQANCSQMLMSFPGLHSANAARKTITAWLESINGHTVDGSPLRGKTNASATYHADISDLSNFNQTLLNRHPSKGSVSIWPSTPDLRFAEMMFDHLFFIAGDKSSPRIRMFDFLREAINDLSSAADIVIFDCPPGFSTIAQAALLSSDIVISPLNVDRVSLWSLKTFWNQGLDDTLDGVASASRYALLTMVRNTSGAQSERMLIRQQISSVANGGRLNTEIPLSVQALRFVHRAALDSTRSFNGKYGGLRSNVEALGNEVRKLLYESDQENANA